MKKFAPHTILAALVIGLAACDESEPGVDQNEQKPEPTTIGIPNGIPVSKTIGANGGTISIAGQVELVIPAGALASDTEISIQPITDNVPNGNGMAFRFAPDGTKFSKPVKVTFPYSSNNSPGLHITGIAFQDADRIWYSAGKFSWDDSNKTVSVETSHFSDWATFDLLHLFCQTCLSNPQGVYQMKVNESAELNVFAIMPDALEPGENDDLSPLVRDDNAYDLIMGEWLANGVKADSGMTAFGKVTPNTTGGTYTAPARAPATGKNPVNISVKLKNLLYRDPATGTIFNELQLVTAVNIVGEFKYDLMLEYYSDDAITGGLVADAFIVKDSASVRVIIKEDLSVISSDTVNSPGIVIPNSKVDPLGNKSTWDGVPFRGPIHVNTCSGIYSSSSSGKQIQLIVTGESELPGFNWVGATGGKASILGTKGGLLQIFIFELNDSIPIWKNPNDELKAKLIPVE